MIKTMEKPKWTKKMREQARLHGSKGGTIVVKKYGVNHMKKIGKRGREVRRKLTSE